MFLGYLEKLRYGSEFGAVVAFFTARAEDGAGLFSFYTK